MRRAEEVTWQPNYIFLYLIVNILLGSFGVCVCVMQVVRGKGNYLESKGRQDKNRNLAISSIELKNFAKSV